MGHLRKINRNEEMQKFKLDASCITNYDFRCNIGLGFISVGQHNSVQITYKAKQLYSIAIFPFV